ncbi:DUF6296 family protein [Kitasatospora sp. DSM 101779]|uniref:DUF6296 family protein n=1 Tax=Kitasatospora sp. DSM 101779 TaxID=2853165 RepID=UPI00398640D7
MPGGPPRPPGSQAPQTGTAVTATGRTELAGHPVYTDESGHLKVEITTTPAANWTTAPRTRRVRPSEPGRRDETRCPLWWRADRRGWDSCPAAPCGGRRGCL